MSKALFLCVEDLSSRRYTYARDQWIVRPARPEEFRLPELSPVTTVVNLIHTARYENGSILEVSESVWPSDRIVIMDDYAISQKPEDLRGSSDGFRR
jgi:GntR family transcriptional regulator